MNSRLPSVSVRFICSTNLKCAVPVVTKPLSAIVITAFCRFASSGLLSHRSAQTFGSSSTISSQPYARKFLISIFTQVPCFALLVGFSFTDAFMLFDVCLISLCIPSPISLSGLVFFVFTNSSFFRFFGSFPSFVLLDSFESFSLMRTFVIVLNSSIVPFKPCIKSTKEAILSLLSCLSFLWSFVSFAT